VRVMLASVPFVDADVASFTRVIAGNAGDAP
jgi:hypothetical protein